MFSAIGFIVWLFLPAVVWLSRKRLRILQRHLAIPFIVAVLFGSILYVGIVRIADAEIENTLYKFDSDGNREFSEVEMTFDAQEAMRRYSTDTRRTLAPVVAAPATLVSTSAWFLLLTLAPSLWRRIKPGSEPRRA